MARLQTDKIIISSFVNVDTAAVVDNYLYITTYVGNFVNIIFDSVISGFGNVVATESRERQYTLFKVYRFFACWLYGFGAVGFFHLLTPFIGGLWLHDEGWTLPQITVLLLVTDFYFKGGRTVLLNFKIAAGLFEPDRYLPLVQGAVNLVVSILLVQRIGVTGVYVVTLVSGIIYRHCFEKKAWVYFRDSLKYIAVILAVGIVVLPIRHMVMKETTILTFAVMVVIITLLYNLVFLAVFHRTEEFAYLWKAVAERVTVLRRISERRPR